MQSLSLPGQPGLSGVSQSQACVGTGALMYVIPSVISSHPSHATRGELGIRSGGRRVAARPDSAFGGHRASTTERPAPSRSSHSHE